MELSERVGKYIDTEEFLKTKDLGASDEGTAWGKRKQDVPDRRTGKRQKPGQREGGHGQVPVTLTPLSRPISEVMAAAEAQNLLKRPNKMKSPPEKRDREKYYRFHRDHGHNTEDCFRLKMAIEKLIERGHLADFVANNRQPRPAAPPPD